MKMILLNITILQCKLGYFIIIILINFNFINLGKMLAFIHTASNFVKLEQHPKVGYLTSIFIFNFSLMHINLRFLNVIVAFIPFASLYHSTCIYLEYILFLFTSLCKLNFEMKIYFFSCKFIEVLMFYDFFYLPDKMLF